MVNETMPEDPLDPFACFVAAVGEPRPAAANRPIDLDDPGVVLFVERGAVDILAAEYGDGRMRSPFRPLVRLERGRLAFGMDLTGHPVKLVAKGLPECRLRCLSLERLVAEIEGRGDAGGLADALTAQIDAWVNDFAAAVVGEMEVHPRIETALSPGSPVRNGFASAGEGVVWVVADGLDATFVDLAHSEPDGPGMMPVTPDSWIDLHSAEGCVCRSSRELGIGPLLTDGLPEFHRLALGAEALNRHLLLVDDANQQRARVARRYNEKIEARRGLSALFEPDASMERDGTALGAALRMIGRWEGISILTPVIPGEAEPSLKDYCEASGARMRRIQLSAEKRWWLGDNGAMLAFRREDGRPVVLLPGRVGGYLVVDPATGRSVPADAEVTNQLRDAYTLYPGLQQGGTATIRELFQVGGAKASFEFAQLTVAGLGAGLLALSPAIAVQFLVGKSVTDGDAVSLIQFSAVLVGLAFAASLAHILRGTALMRLEGRLAARLGAALQDRLLRLRSGFFRRHSAGELTARAMVFQDIRDNVAGIAVDALFSTLFALPALVLIFFFSAALGWAALCLAIVAVGLTAAFCVLHFEPQRRHQEALRTLTAELHQFLSGIAKLRVTGSEVSAFAAWAGRYREQKRLEIRLSVLSERTTAFCAAMPALASAVLFLVVPKGSDADLSTGDFLAVYTAAMVFFFSVVTLGNSSKALSYVKPACEQVRPILESPTENRVRNAVRPTLAGELLLDRVTFGYPGTGKIVLDEVTIHAKRGEFVAIVGTSGAGKSTLFRLALGLEKPLSGSVCYDGRDLAHLDLSAVRGQLGVVTQHGDLRNGTILENIIGAGGDFTAEDAWRAASDAAVDRDIKAMPMGLHTAVAENSVTLSGGQSQRIRIAAALVGRPRVIFLDEPTSWLDTKSQAETMKGIERLTATRFIIAHRLSTIRMASRIYVLHQGRVAQVGRFRELLAVEGPFRDLALRQMAG